MKLQKVQQLQKLWLNPVTTATEPAKVAPVEIPTITPAISTTETNVTNTLPISGEKSDTMIDSLVNNEQTQVGEQLSPVAATQQNADDGMSLDLDSLTQDLNPTSSTTIGATVNPNNDAVPVTASVTLPQMTVVQPMNHSSAKKKAFAMIAAFLLLLVVG